MGVIFLGLPVSSLSGSNQASNLARLKGELEAVQKAIILKGGQTVTPLVPQKKQSALRLQFPEELLEFRVILEHFQIGILLHPVEIVVAERDGFAQ